MTDEQRLSRLREHAELLERANVRNDMGLSVLLSQAADAMRDAADRLEPLAASSPPAWEPKIRALIETWQKAVSEEDGNTLWDAGFEEAMHRCAAELEALLPLPPAPKAQS